MKQHEFAIAVGATPLMRPGPGARDGFRPDVKATHVMRLSTSVGISDGGGGDAWKTGNHDRLECFHCFVFPEPQIQFKGPICLYHCICLFPAPKSVRVLRVSDVQRDRTPIGSS